MMQVFSERCFRTDYNFAIDESYFNFVGSKSVFTWEFNFANHKLSLVDFGKNR